MTYLEPRVPLGMRQAAAMRARGMSPAGVRHALGLSPAEASEWGLVEPIVKKCDDEEDADTPAPTVEEPRGLWMRDVITAVEQVSGVPRETFMAPSQGRANSTLRHLAMFVIRARLPGASLPAIGNYFGLDHSTIHYGCTRAMGLLETDDTFWCLSEQVNDFLDGRT